MQMSANTTICRSAVLSRKAQFVAIFHRGSDKQFERSPTLMNFTFKYALCLTKNELLE